MTLPSAPQTYTFTVSYAGDKNHQEKTASCTVTVTKKSSSGSNNTQTEPVRPVEPTPDPPAADHPFTDVSVKDWYREAVQYVYGHGLMNGVSDTSFGPELPTTRAEMAAMLMGFCQRVSQ